MQSRSNLPFGIPLVPNGTTRGQQHKNLKPGASWIEHTEAGKAIILSIRPLLGCEIPGQLLAKKGPSGSEIQPRSGSEIAPIASIGSLACNTLTSSSERFGRHTMAIAVNKAHPMKPV